VWVAPGNFARMADITATDLMRLYPDCADRIGENLRSFKQELFRLRSEYEARLAAAQWFEVLALTRDFSPLLEEFGVQTVAVMDKPEHRWTDRDVRKLERTLADNHVHVVVCVWNPRVDIASAIERAGARVLVLDSFAVSGEPDARSVLRHYQTNLQRLLDALSGDPAGQ
jgi:ABC-type Zn uptake system ZnuABC Zn-binding protein ZnuA